MKTRDVGSMVGSWWLVKSERLRKKGFDAYLVEIVDTSNDAVLLRDLNGRLWEDRFSAISVLPIPDNWIIDRISSLNDFIWDAEVQILALLKLLSHSVPVNDLTIPETPIKDDTDENINGSD